MKRKFFILALIAISLCGVNSTFAQTGNSLITFKTNQSVGMPIKLYIKATGNVEISGISGTWEDGKYIEYNLTNQTVTIKGDITVFDCGNNQITMLDVSNCPSLNTLYCHTNDLSGIDITRNKKLKTLVCTRNKIETLNVKENTLLKKIECYCNKLENLDVSNNTELTELSCDSNKISVLDLTHCKKIQYLYCYDNKITKLKVDPNSSLFYIACYQNQIKENDMDELVNSLPDFSQGTTQGIFLVYNNKRGDERNECTTVQVNKLREKGWLAQKFIEDEGWQEYEGIPSCIDAIKNMREHNERIYNVEGCRVDIPQKGINIIKTANGETIKVLKK